MKNNIQNGSTLVELIMNMTLLLLFGITIFTLIYSGAGTQERLMREKDDQSNARIALAYLNVRLRQSDSNGKISVEVNELTGENAILIRERTESSQYDTWIFWYEGKLMECLVNANAPPSVQSSFYIVDAEGMDISFDKNSGTVTNTIHYNLGDSLASMSSTLRLRSYNMYAQESLRDSDIGGDYDS